MNKEEIMKLVNAGYSKAEIEAMTVDAKPADEKPAEQSKPEEPEPKPAEASVFTPDMIKEFTGAINGLSEMIKKSNMVNDGYEPKTALERGEEVLATLINPPQKK